MSILAALGLTAILVEGRIMKFPPFSYIKSLPGLDCWQCTGFWAGGIVYYLTAEHGTLDQAFVFALVCSFLSFLTKNILDNMDNQTYEST